MSSYFDQTSDADAIAATLPGLASYTAATTDQKTAALELASAIVDGAVRYQGRKVAADQVLQFPRVPNPRSPSSGISGCGQPGGQYLGRQSADTHYAPPAAGEVVWDRDDDGNFVVPNDVLRAVVIQADAVLSPSGAQSQARQQAILDGLSAQSVGGMSESYRDPYALGEAARLAAMLAPRAMLMINKYRLKNGRIL